MHDRNGAEREEAARNGHKYSMQSDALNEELLNYKNTKIQKYATSRRFFFVQTVHFVLCTIFVGQPLPGKGSLFQTILTRYYDLCFLSE
jgi:hypothetical protein